MFTLTKTRRAPIGLHLGVKSVGVVQLVGTQDSFDWNGAIHVPIPDLSGKSPQEADLAITSILKQLLVDHRMTGRSVMGCLNADDLYIETIRIPQMSADELSRAVRWEASERLPYPVDEADLRYLIAGEVRQESGTKLEVILIACRHEIIRRRLAIFEGAGLSPIGLDIEPCAWLRALHRASGSRSAARSAYIHCGESSTTILFAEGSKILFLKPVPFGGTRFDSAVATALGIDSQLAREMRADVFDAAALDGENEVHRSVIDAIRPGLDGLIAEIEQCMRYHKVTFRGRTLEHLVLFGSEAAPWLSDYLGERVGLTPQTVNPLSNLRRMPTSTNITHRPGRWATPMGLAMKRLEM